jgi:hypothetical protein
MKIKKVVAVSFVIIILVSCVPAEKVVSIETTILPPTNTPIPTSTLTLTPTSTPPNTETPTSTPSPTPLPETVLLNIPPRGYDSIDYCGELVVQEALLYFGKFVHQRDINRQGGKGGGHVGLFGNEIETALINMGIEYNVWRLSDVSYEEYLEFLKNKLAQNHPILVGVKTSKTGHPEWYADHFILLKGYNKNSFIFNSPEEERIRSFELFQYGNPGDGNGFTLTNSYNIYFGIEFIGIND